MASKSMTTSEKMSAGWERSDFPIVCEKCLGDDKHLRMTKSTFDEECKMCSRPFTVFKWKPGKKAQPKKTEVCQSCSKLQNICQSCILDLEFGLPVHIRDHGLANPSGLQSLSGNTAQREWMLDQAKADYETSGNPWANRGLSSVVDALTAKSQQTQKRLDQICEFFIRGSCEKGEFCMFRHSSDLQSDPRITPKSENTAKKGEFKVKTVFLASVKNAETKETPNLDVSEIEKELGVSGVKLIKGGKAALVEIRDEEAAERVEKCLKLTSGVSLTKLGAGQVKAAWAQSANEAKAKPAPAKKRAQGPDTAKKGDQPDQKKSRMQLPGAVTYGAQSGIHRGSAPSKK